MPAQGLRALLITNRIRPVHKPQAAGARGPQRGRAWEASGPPPLFPLWAPPILLLAYYFDFLRFVGLIPIGILVLFFMALMWPL